MALQGTLDTFALADVLRLLATTKKSGQLLVEGDQGSGSLSLDEGSVVGGTTTLVATDGPDEVLFELLRLDDGSFVFDADSAPEATGGAVDVETLIASAEAAHDEWQDLSTVVPSLDVGVLLNDELPDDSTTIDRDRWKLIVTIGSGTTVRALGGRLGLKELPVLRATRGLVDDGLASIGEPEVEAPPTPPAAAAPAEPASALPSLDDEPEPGDIFGGGEQSDDLPEPLPSGEAAADLLPSEAAILEEQINGLPQDQRELIERAAGSGDPDEAEQVLAELPDGGIDHDLLRRFLGSVRS